MQRPNPITVQRTFLGAATLTLIGVIWTPAALGSGDVGSAPRPVVRVHDGVVESRPALRPIRHDTGGGVAGSATCPLAMLAGEGQPIDQGTLDPLAFFNSAALAGGRIAFFGTISGAERNQGVFRADASGTAVAIAIGSGNGGGGGNPGNPVGDPTPIGGTFAGFFGGTFFVPAINAAGDVLFLADVTGGTSPRGLFLAHNGGAIENIAKVGGAAPGGGTFTQVGHGSMNDLGTVVFVAKASVDSGPGIFQWSNGTLTKIAKPGTAAPGGGAYTILVGESLGFVDGTTIPVGPLPDINNSGTICFRTLASGAVSRGIVIRTAAGVSTWAVKANTATPIGGTYLDMQGAAINDAGALEFFADVSLGGGQYTGGHFAGLPGSLHATVAFYDPIDGGTVNGLAFSRNPMQAIAADGSAIAWCSVLMPNGLEQDRLIRIAADGTKTTIAAKGDPSANGGTIGTIDAWPSIQSGFGATVSTGTPGSPGGTSAHQLAPDCNCLGDLTGDGEVDAEDLAFLLGGWGGGGPADLNGNGAVDAADVAILLGAWGACG